MRNDREKDDLAVTVGQIDAMTREGAVVDVDPDDAEALGAVEETALSEQNALDSRFDEEGV